MEKIKLGNSNLQSSRLVYGCMRISGDNSLENRKKGKAAIYKAIELGFTNFDHADIYGGGNSETLFGEILEENKELRDKIIITGKCGIRLSNEPEKGNPGRYDFSDEHITSSVEGSLKRLKTDHLDMLLLHRPDYLFNADKVAKTLQKLKDKGLVNYFGVSNFKPSQFKLLQSRLDFDLLVNQIEINIHNISSLEDGTIDQCQELEISPQAWCPLGGVAYPAWGNTFTKETEKRIENELARQSEKYNSTQSAIILAWLLRHPSQILPIIGSTSIEHIEESVKSFDISYTREDWYQLLEARNGIPVP
ncbi:MAG: aldo/keto reductase [Deltaproteobacteria bacterium]|nr:aldo/keto reductase [Deltaproteobacteria bacterium]